MSWPLNASPSCRFLLLWLLTEERGAEEQRNSPSVPRLVCAVGEVWAAGERSPASCPHTAAALQVLSCSPVNLSSFSLAQLSQSVLGSAGSQPAGCAVSTGGACSHASDVPRVEILCFPKQEEPS